MQEQTVKQEFAGRTHIYKNISDNVSVTLRDYNFLECRYYKQDLRDATLRFTLTF